MSMFPCPTCSHNISSKATSCPRCGEVFKNAPPARSVFTTTLIVVLSLVLIAIAIPILAAIVIIAVPAFMSARHESKIAAEMATNQLSKSALQQEFRKVQDELLNVADTTRWKRIDGEVVQIVAGEDALIRADNYDEMIYLVNCPNADSLIDGSPVNAWAVPAGIKEYRTVLGANKRVLSFDAGSSPSGSELYYARKRWDEANKPKPNPVLIPAQTPTPVQASIDQKTTDEFLKGISGGKEKAEKELRDEQIAAANRIKQARIDKIVNYQHTQASNGLPSFQLELGKRYLRGDGVETNRALALHWLQSAATNRDSQAVKLLSEISR